MGLEGVAHRIKRLFFKNAAGKKGQRAAKGGRPLTFFGHFLVAFSRFRSLFGNLFLVFGFLIAYPLLPSPFSGTAKRSVSDFS